MKKYYIFIIFIFIFALIFVIGCNIKSSQIIKNTSSLTKSFFFYEDNEYIIEVYSGQRELDFVYDGISTKKVPFGIVKIIIKKDINNKYIKARLDIDKQIKEIILEKNPFDDSYMVDIEKEIKNENLINITILDNNVKTFNLKNYSLNFKSYKNILDVCYNSLKQFIKNNGNNYEGYLSVVHHKQNDKMQFYYSYMLLYNQNKRAILLIDCFNQEVLVKWQSD